MTKLSKFFYLTLAMVLIIFLTTGCEMPRDGDENGDLGPVDELPPTLAPLSAESSSLSGEATPIPTVIQVESTATLATEENGQAAMDSAERPTTEPASLNSSEAEEAAAVSPETFTAPTVEASPAVEEQIVVDAAPEEEPIQEPVAANPPASETTGDYGYSSDTTYTVQPGDTLFSIAMRHGTTVQAIIYANDLVSDVIQVGQVLYIPADDGSYTPSPDYGPAPVPEGSYHIVAAGETLYRIALKYGTSVQAIAGFNGIPYPYVIYKGQQLMIPPSGPYTGPMPPPPTGGYNQPPIYESEPGYYAPDEESYSPPAYSDARTHTVAPGETLFSIAQRYGTTVEALFKANGLTNPDQIFVGQVLYLP